MNSKAKTMTVRCVRCGWSDYGRTAAMLRAQLIHRKLHKTAVRR